ncbi:FAD-binding protein [Alkaliphilus hydrothermalis]|uniref:Flavin-dependent dehydrogenase n=1 Tax=Alkaliphilus hydrothermalis TaxID=1482730 RepID=A0ABS2NNK6_9FIRM|nr:FAD-binding protein [Alkaliphilus hydrothermalis]MBM7614523.1 flavin-dependent dehydrogenase [Alkaliphilus hydrothermalis]
MYDVVIIGAGPAGSTLARLIGDKYKVLLIDKRDLENENSNNRINKCCGGLLAPDAQKMIAKLGLGIPKDVLVDPQLFAVKTIDLSNNIERLYQRFYYNMDREKFDRWLVSILPVGVDKKFNAIFKHYTEISGGYEVTFTHNRRELSTKTRLIVGADGALSKIRKSISIYRNTLNTPEKYVSIQEWFECSERMPYFTAIFDEEVSDFYSWIIPKENYILLGAALRPRDNTREKYEQLKSKLKQFGFNLEHRVKTEGAFINRTKKLSQLYAGRDGIALVGEAAGAISPSSAEGFSYAMKSALYLAESLDEGIDGFMDRYIKKVKGIKTNLLMKNLKSPAMYNPRLRYMAMKSGLQSI